MGCKQKQNRFDGKKLPASLYSARIIEEHLLQRRIKDSLSFENSVKYDSF